MSKDQSHPWAGNPRQFVAVAMPNGDAMFGIEGPLVFLTERRGECQDRPKFLSRAEAEQLRDALDSALRSFGLAAAMSEHFADRDGLSPNAALLEALARPATDPYPFRNHGTLADHGFCDANDAPESEAA